MTHTWPEVPSRRLVPLFRQNNFDLFAAYVFFVLNGVKCPTMFGQNFFFVLHFQFGTLSYTEAFVICVGTQYLPTSNLFMAIFILILLIRHFSALFFLFSFCVCMAHSSFCFFNLPRSTAGVSLSR